jgi:hypothetical protein
VDQSDWSCSDRHIPPSTKQVSGVDIKRVRPTDTNPLAIQGVRRDLRKVGVAATPKKCATDENTTFSRSQAKEATLRRPVADLSLDKEMPQEALGTRLTLATHHATRSQVGAGQTEAACGLVSVGRTRFMSTPLTCLLRGECDGPNSSNRSDPRY